jgi:corrinoid protein of di/trimethylamine methyltransferase
MIKKGGITVQEHMSRIMNIVINGKKEELLALVKEVLNQGVPAKQIIDHGLIAGMDVVGQRMKSGEMFIPEVLASARNMQSAMEMLAPQLIDFDRSAYGTVVIGTVEGDLHDIGKNLVALMLEGAGFTVVDLGVNVKPASFVDAVKLHKADIVGLSALLTTTMVNMIETINAFEEAGLRNQIKFMAGGAPVTQKLVEDIGADGYGSSAAIAVDLAKTFIAKKT